MNSDRKIFWTFQFLFWTTYFAYNIFLVHYNSLFQSEYNPLLLIIYLTLLCFFGIPLTLLARKFYEKVNYTETSLLRIFLSACLVAVVLANLWIGEIYLLDKTFNRVMEYEGVISIDFKPLNDIRIYFWDLFFTSLLLLTWIAFYLFLTFWKEWLRQKLDIENTALQLENAQLKMLRSQISPHFLFNSLSSLRALIREDSKTAERMLTKISDFLRYSLIKQNNTEVPFSEELNATKNYFSIEKVRFGDKLQVKYSIDDLAEDFPVPAFILHPLIENGVKYGMATSPMPLQITINAHVHGNTLIVEIINSGKWKADKKDIAGTGTGLLNIKNRLKSLYPGRHKLRIERLDGSVKITITIECDIKVKGRDHV